MIEVSRQDQERIEQILAARCPDATTILDLDADGVDLMKTRLGGVYDAVLCVGPAFEALSSRDELQAAFRMFTAHSRFGTQLIVRKPTLVHQAVLEWRARSAWFGFFAAFGDLRVFGYRHERLPRRRRFLGAYKRIGAEALSIERRKHRRAER